MTATQAAKRGTRKSTTTTTTTEIVETPVIETPNDGTAVASFSPETGIVFDEAALADLAKEAVRKIKAAKKAAAVAPPATTEEAPRLPLAERRAAGLTKHPASERKNDVRRPEGAAAVAAVGCSQCGAGKGDRCYRGGHAAGKAGTVGERTPYVHRPRMEAAAKISAKAPRGRKAESK